MAPETVVPSSDLLRHLTMVHAQFSGVRIGSGIHLTGNHNPDVGASKTAIPQQSLNGEAPGHSATEIDLTIPRDVEAWNDCDASSGSVLTVYDMSMMIDGCGAVFPTLNGPLFGGVCSLADDRPHRGRRRRERGLAHGSNKQPRTATREYLLGTASSFKAKIAVSDDIRAQRAAIPAILPELNDTPITCARRLPSERPRRQPAPRHSKNARRSA